MLKENTFLYISNILIHLEKYRDFLIGDSKIFDKVMKLRQSHIENLKNEYGLDIDLI